MSSCSYISTINALFCWYNTFSNGKSKIYICLCVCVYTHYTQTIICSNCYMYAPAKIAFRHILTSLERLLCRIRPVEVGDAPTLWCLSISLINSLAIDPNQVQNDLCTGTLPKNTYQLCNHHKTRTQRPCW